MQGAVDLFCNGSAEATFLRIAGEKRLALISECFFDCFQDREGLDPSFSIDNQSGYLSPRIEIPIPVTVLFTLIKADGVIAEVQLLEPQADLETMGCAGTPASVELQ